MPSAACWRLAAQRRALLISAIVPLLFGGCATTGPDGYPGSAADDQKCRELTVERQEEQKQEETSRRQSAKPRQRSDNPERQSRPQSTARLIAGVILVPIVLAGLPVIIVGAVVETAKEALALPFTELSAQTGIGLGTDEARRRRAEVLNERERAATIGTFVATCVQVLRTEREFGPDDSRMIGPLAAFGDAYVRVGAFNHADLVYRRAATIAEKNLDPKVSHQLIEMLIRFGDIQAGGGMLQLADDMYRWALAIAEQHGIREGAVVELALWESIKASGDASDFQRYLEQFPSGRYANLAKMRASGLRPSPSNREPLVHTGVGCRPFTGKDEQVREGQKATDWHGQVYECADGIWHALPSESIRPAFGCPALADGPPAKHLEQSIHASGATYLCDDGIWRLLP